MDRLEAAIYDICEKHGPAAADGFAKPNEVNNWTDKAAEEWEAGKRCRAKYDLIYAYQGGWS